MLKQCFAHVDRGYLQSSSGATFLLMKALVCTAEERKFE